MASKRVIQTAANITVLLRSLPPKDRCDCLALVCRAWIEHSALPDIRYTIAAGKPFGPTLGPLKRKRAGAGKK